jgi:hypothetical protein
VDLMTLAIDAGLAALAVVAPVVLAYLARLASRYVGVVAAEAARARLADAIDNAIAEQRKLRGKAGALTETEVDSAIGYVRQGVPDALDVLRAGDDMLKRRIAAKASE